MEDDDDDCVVATDRARGGFVRRNINNKGVDPNRACLRQVCIV